MLMCNAHKKQSLVSGLIPETFGEHSAVTMLRASILLDQRRLKSTLAKGPWQSDETVGHRKCFSLIGQLVQWVRICLGV